MQHPPLGFTTNVSFVRVIDADTILVEFKRQFKVRIKNLLCEEKNKKIGKEAKQFAEGLFRENDNLILHVHCGQNNEKLTNIFTFDRIVGQIWTKDGENYGEIIVGAGHGRWLKENEKGRVGI